MSLLSGLSTPADVQEDKDILGGGSYQLDSGVYDAIITYAYVEKNDKGTLVLSAGFKMEDDTEIKQSIYLTKNTGETYYTTKSGEKRPMSGFVVGEALALFGAQKPLSELASKTAVVKVYNKELRKEVPTEVPMLTELLNKPVKLGLKKIIKPGGSYNGDRKWIVDNTKSFTFNEIDKVFHPKSGMTVNELRAKSEEAKFIKGWADKWQGKVDDQRTDGGAAESAAAVGASTETKSLFAS